MILLRRRHAIVAASAALALLFPFLLLQGDTPPKVGAALVTRSAPVEARPSGSLSFALVAPPFDPDRKPDADAAPGDPLAGLAGLASIGAPVSTPDAAAAPPLPKLVGIASGGGGRGAALVKDSSGQTVIVSAGESVNGWRLVAVGEDRAVFRHRGVRQTARLEFESSGGSADSGPSFTAIPPPPPPTTMSQAAEPGSEAKVRN
jgi:hypothetical protein